MEPLEVCLRVNQGSPPQQVTTSKTEHDIFLGDQKLPNSRNFGEDVILAEKS